MKLTKSQFQRPNPLRTDSTNDNLIGASLGIDIDSTATLYRQAIRQIKLELRCIAPPDNPINRRLLVLERKIDVP